MNGILLRKQIEENTVLWSIENFWKIWEHMFWISMSQKFGCY